MLDLHADAGAQIVAGIQHQPLATLDSVNDDDSGAQIAPTK